MVGDRWGGEGSHRVRNEEVHCRVGRPAEQSCLARARTALGPFSVVRRRFLARRRLAASSNAIRRRQKKEMSLEVFLRVDDTAMDAWRWE